MTNSKFGTGELTPGRKNDQPRITKPLVMRGYFHL